MRGMIDKKLQYLGLRRLAADLIDRITQFVEFRCRGGLFFKFFCLADSGRRKGGPFIAGKAQVFDDRFVERMVKLYACIEPIDKLTNGLVGLGFVFLELGCEILLKFRYLLPNFGKQIL